MVVSRRSGVSTAGTWASGTCTVASTTDRRSAWNIIRTSPAPVSSASNSVCPRQRSPARAHAPLLMGAVARPSMRSARASRVARMTIWYAARPAAADTTPDRKPPATRGS